MILSEKYLSDTKCQIYDPVSFLTKMIHLIIDNTDNLLDPYVTILKPLPSFANLPSRTQVENSSIILFLSVL